MLRHLITYLLLVVTCSFFLMSMKELHLDNFVKAKSKEITKAFIRSDNNCSVVQAKSNHTFPISNILLIENFDLENEVEIEIDDLPTIDLTPEHFSLTNNIQRVFLSVYSTYSFTVIKIEFLDIFSPPPNC